MLEPHLGYMITRVECIDRQSEIRGYSSLVRRISTRIEIPTSQNVIDFTLVPRAAGWPVVVTAVGRNKRGGRGRGKGSLDLEQKEKKRAEGELEQEWRPQTHRQKQ